MRVQEIRKVLNDLDTNGVDELIMAKAGLVALNSGYADAGVDTPEWVIDGINLLAKEITGRNRAALTAQLKRLKASREALATVAEKRKAADEAIAALEAKLS